MLPVTSEHGNIQTRCICCRIPVDISAALPIRIGSLVKFDEDEDVIDPKGDVITVTRTRVFPASVKGMGCEFCAGLQMKADGLEGVRREKYQPQHQDVSETIIQVNHEGKTYEQRGEKWYDVQTHISVPVLVGHVLRKIEERVEHQESRKVLIGKGLDKRTAFVDVREQVLGMRSHQ